MIKIISLIILLFFFRLYASEVESKDPDKFSIKSYKQVDVTKFNLDLAEAKKRGDEWIFSPILITLNFHKISALRFVNIKQKSDRAECPLNSVVTIVEEGFLDDEMRGKWIQFHFQRKVCEKPWRIKEVREAYLCGRPGSKEVFAKDLCK